MIQVLRSRILRVLNVSEVTSLIATVSFDQDFRRSVAYSDFLYVLGFENEEAVDLVSL